MTKASSDNTVTDNIETIVEIGGEGGAVTLEGHRGASGAWQFRLTTNAAAMWRALLDEEPPPQEEPKWVSTWTEALTLLDRYPWPRLHPVELHPEFKEAVFRAITEHPEGGPGQVERWLDDLASWGRLR